MYPNPVKQHISNLIQAINAAVFTGGNMVHDGYDLSLFCRYDSKSGLTVSYMLAAFVYFIIY